MKIYILLISLFLTAPLSLRADTESLRNQYQQLMSVYEERREEIQGDLERKERELLNEFIVSLVRVEQRFRDEGDLDGVVLTREMRERLLEEAEFPELNENAPEELRDRISSLHEDRDAIREGEGEKLKELNRMFYNRLEPVMRELTRAGDFDTAREMLTLRRRLADTFSTEADAGQTGTPRRELGMSSDPNVFPISVEPRSLGQIVGLTARRPQIPFEPVIEGGVTPADRWMRLRNGRFTVPADATEAMVHQVRQNQMFTLEFGFYTDHGHQGFPAMQVPAGLFLFGNNREEANLIVNQEGRNLILYLRTDSPPDNRDFHRVDLGRVDTGRMVHYTVTYRSGELTVYFDGVETRKIRGEITGLLNGWESFPFHIGAIDTPSPQRPVGHWRGNLVFVYMRASHESSRGVAANYTRFANFVTAPR